MGAEEFPVMRGDTFAGYSPLAGVYDELMDQAGNIRAHWQPFVQAFGNLDEADRDARAGKLKRLVRENGIAHDIFTDSSVSADPWKINLIPLIFAPDEWRWIEKALTQRAHLLDAVLKDIYGPQELLKSGKIPPRLIFNDPAFLRPCKGIKASGRFLDFYAADLARGPDGQWRVIDSHAETPAGSGFALVNRVVHSQVAGDLFRRCNALRLASYYQRLQTELLTRANRDDPVIALLTPGPHHEDYFGHAYLARYLGFILVEGGDLRVIGSRVYMKTLEGLQPVDLIIRCVEGAGADPLELDPSGFLGPAGLLQAVRKYPHLAVNSIGSAIAENRALGDYLPGLCKELLGEDLALLDSPRCWLGDPACRQQFFNNFDRMVVRRAHEGTGRPGRAERAKIPAGMSAAGRESLKLDIGLNGDALVAEEQIGLATLPSWTSKGLRPRPYAVRLYVAVIGGEYQVMPGGIALTIETDSAASLAAPEGYSRDVWVVSPTEITSYATLLRPPADESQIHRAGKGLRSRVADNLFWLGRYAERADWTMRLMRGALSRWREDRGPLQSSGVIRQALYTLLNKDRRGLKALEADTTPTAIEQLVETLMSSSGRSYGLRRTLENLHCVASLVRNRLSVEVWRTLQTFHSQGAWRREAGPASAGEALDLLDGGIGALAAFNGMVAENMTRNYGWRFLDIGHRLERASNLAELLLALFGQAREEDDETGGLLFTLEVADCIITFRSRYLFAPVMPLVLDLLLIDEANPRSIAFQLAAISAHLEALPQASHGRVLTEEQRMILDLLTRVRLAKVMALSQAGENRSRNEFKALFSQLITELPRLSEAITRRYFNLTEDQLRRVYTRFGPRS